MNFNNKIEFAEFIKTLRGDSWIVGGSIRDEILGIESNDLDIIVTGVDVDSMPFEKVVGDSFPVFLVTISGEKCEVALARKEKKNGIGHKGFNFFTDKSLTIFDDLSRRDLTINAMAKNILSDELVDPFCGINDINKKILRHTTEAFSDDPLRVFRVARFGAQLEFSVASETLALMKSMKGELNSLPPERVCAEMLKALSFKKPSRFFEILKDADVLDVFFDELSQLDVPDKHDGTAFNHVMRVIDFGENQLERFGLLVHDFGKGLTPIEEHPSHHGHDKLGKSAVIDFCNRLKTSNELSKFGIICCTEHMKFKRAHEMRAGKLFRWMCSIENHFTDMARVSFIDSAFRDGGNIRETKAHLDKMIAVFNNALDIKRTINGKQLIDEGREPGPAFAEILLQRRIERFKKTALK